MTRDPGSLDTELVAYQIIAGAPAIRPAANRRSWMSGTHEHFAYMCLPLVAANVSGWELLCPAGFSACWDGGAERDSVQVKLSSVSRWSPVSHFGNGILTFDSGYVFRTSHGHSLWVKGPTNEFKDAISPLEGIIETDWLPYTFTMNYRFTRSNQIIQFEEGEPFCLIHPMPSSYLGRIEPVLRLLSQDPELELQLETWTTKRKRWNAERLVPGTTASTQKWRRDYLRGQTATGEKATQHLGVPKLKLFRDERVR